MRHFGESSFEVNVVNETPGPQRISAWKPIEGTGTECGMIYLGINIWRVFSGELSAKLEDERSCAFIKVGCLFDAFF